MIICVSVSVYFLTSSMLLITPLIQAGIPSLGAEWIPLFPKPTNQQSVLVGTHWSASASTESRTDQNPPSGAKRTPWSPGSLGNYLTTIIPIHADYCEWLVGVDHGTFFVCASRKTRKICTLGRTLSLWLLVSVVITLVTSPMSGWSCVFMNDSNQKWINPSWELPRIWVKSLIWLNV